jgi:thioesterase domain-containing protein
MSHSSPTGIAEQKKLLAELMLQGRQTETYAASLAQRRLWFLDQLQGSSAAYNVHVGLWLEGPLDVAALRASVQEIVNRHDSLRTAFRLEGGELLQVVLREYTVNLPVMDVTFASNYAEAYEIAKREVESPFDLSRAPLFRARLLRYRAEEHIFLCTMHHVVTDAWSMQIFAKELFALYEAFSSGKPSPLRELPIGYGDYSEWQLEWLGTEKLQQELTYWRNRLARAPAFLELPTDKPRPAEQTSAGASQYVPISSDIIAGIKVVAARYRATPFMLLLAAFKVLLFRYSGQHDVLVGVPVAGRSQVETEKLIGFFVNTLAMRDDLSGNPRFSDLIAQVRETTLGAYANAEVPFEKVVEIVQPERNLSYNPIFQVMFATIKSAVRSHQFGNLTAYPYVVASESSIFDITMTVIQGIDEQWFAEIEYNTDLFTPERIAAIFADYTALLQAIKQDPEARILDLPLLIGVDRKRVSGPGLRSESGSRKTPQTPSTSVRSHVEDTGAEEKLLVEIWKQVLGKDVGIHDNFFDVGGHSLLAARLIAQIQAETGRKMPVSAMFRAPTIETFARLLKDEFTQKPDPVMMSLHDGDGVIPFFAVAAPGVDTFGLALLAQQLGKEQSVYKLQSSGPAIWDRPYRSEELTAWAREYIAAMRLVQPRGPYYVGGMCAGVQIAQQMILEMEAQGEEVALFTIFDTWVLENSQIRALWAIDYYRQRFRVLRSQLWREQLATIWKAVRRSFWPSSAAASSGWRETYWPGKGFQAPRFRAPVLLFKRPRQPFHYVRDPQMGWGARSMGGVEICEVRCGHIEVLREPYVRVVAQILASRLQAARDRKEQARSVFAADNENRSGSSLDSLGRAG